MKNEKCLKTTSKKALHRFTALAAVLLAVCLVFMTPVAAEAWDGSTVDTTTWYNDVSTEFTISTPAQLAGLAELVNEGKTFKDKTIKLNADIDLDGKAWTPIGNGQRSGSSYSGNSFSGTFDGAGYTISNLKITTSGAEDNAVGLFGVLNGGTVKNLVLSNVQITLSSCKNAGAAIGLMVNGATAENIYVSSGSVSAVDGVGGVVGRMTISGTIKDCINSATVGASTAENAAVGGIVGKAYYTGETGEMNIQNCVNTGEISSTYASGGIAGFSTANVNGCMNTGKITSSGTSAGGIVGEQNVFGEVSGNSNKGIVDGTTYAGGIVGWVRYSSYDANNYKQVEIISVSGNTNEADVKGNTHAGGIVGVSYHPAVIQNNINLASKIEASTEGQNCAGGIVGSAYGGNGHGIQSLDNSGITVSSNFVLDTITITGAKFDKISPSEDGTYVTIDKTSTLSVSKLSITADCKTGTVSADKSEAYKGEIVEVTIGEPNDGYGTPVTLSIGTIIPVKVDDKYLFMMPNKEITVSAEFTEKPVVAKIGGTSYYSLEVAVGAAQSGETIVLQNDVTLTETLTIPAGKTVTLDLNGKTISQTKECTASYNMIGNLGSLTIVDTVGGGELSFTDSGNGDPNFGWGSYTIHNSGTLIIGDEDKEAVDFTIEHIGSQTSHCANAIFQYSGSTTIYGGKISTPNYRSVRLWMGELTIYDGTFTGNVWVHNGGTWDTNTVNIYGGTFSPGTKGGDSIYSLLIENTKNQITLNIDGGTFTSDIHVYDETKITASISGGTFTNDVSAYVEDGNICKEESAGKFIVTEIPEDAVVPEKPVVNTQEGTDSSTTIITPSDETDSTPINQADGKTDEVVIGDEDSDAVIIRLTGVTVYTDGTSGDVTSVTVPTDAEIIAEYKEDAVNGAEYGTTFTLELKIEKVDASLPVIDSTIQEDILGDNQPEHNVLAMITAINADKNDNIKEDGKAITIKFKIPEVAVKDKSMLRAYHVDIYGDPELLPITIDGPESGFYTITIYGASFSSYVLVEEEPEEEEIVNNNGGGGKDTGSGNYQYYPRDVPTNGIVDFGTSKVVTGMELPAGSSGKVTLNIKPTFAMPENGFYAFEIDAPGYNLDAKINGGLSFQIPVADLEAAGWTAEDIVLFHGTVGEDGKITWEALPTNLVKNENGVAYYKAAINGCSPFYIGFVKDGSVVNTEVVDPVTPPTEEPDVPGEDLPDIPGVQDEPEEPSSPAPILAVLAGLGAAVVLRRK